MQRTPQSRPPRVLRAREFANDLSNLFKKQWDAVDIRVRGRGVFGTGLDQLAVLAWSMRVGHYQRPTEAGRSRCYRGVMKYMDTTFSELERQTRSTCERLKAFEQMADRRDYEIWGAS